MALEMYLFGFTELDLREELLVDVGQLAEALLVGDDRIEGRRRGEILPSIPTLGRVASRG